MTLSAAVLTALPQPLQSTFLSHYFNRSMPRSARHSNRKKNNSRACWVTGPPFSRWTCTGGLQLAVAAGLCFSDRRSAGDICCGCCCSIIINGFFDICIQAFRLHPKRTLRALLASRTSSCCMHAFPSPAPARSLFPPRLVGLFHQEMSQFRVSSFASQHAYYCLKTGRRREFSCHVESNASSSYG